MEKVGVAAVIEGLGGFLDGMGKMDKAVRDLIPGNTLLERAFLSLGDTISNFAGSILRSLEYALGNLIASAIQGVITVIRDLISATVDAGIEFQNLEIRLRGINLADLTTSGMEYNEAMKEAIKLTEEQLRWIQKLAVTTPFDIEDIANIYTLARAYNLTNEEAQILTTSITDFSAGMNLTDVQMKRIIENFGQMIQQGKVTSTELRDLARGSLVPINDVLMRMQENTGLAGEEFIKFRNSAEGVEAFMVAFSQVVDEQWAGAAERASRSFQGASRNLQDLIHGMVGLNVIKPILDSIGGKIADFVATLAEEGNWNRITAAMGHIGDVLVEIIEALFGLLPSTKDVATGIVDALNNIASWLLLHKDDIVDWIKDAVMWFKEELIPQIMKVWEWLFGEKEEGGAIQGFFTWLNENGPAIGDIVRNIADAIGSVVQWISENKGLIGEFMATLGDIVVQVIDNLIGNPSGVKGGSVLDVIKKVMQFVIDHKEDIARWVELFIRLAIAVEIAKTVFALLGGGILLLIDIIFKIGAAILFLLSPFGKVIAIGELWIASSRELKTTLIAVFTEIKDQILGIIMGIWTGAHQTFTNLWADLVRIFDNIKNSVLGAWITLKTGAFTIWESIKESIMRAIDRIKEVFANSDWLQIGWNMIQGIVDGIWQGASSLIDAVVQVAANAYNALTSALGIQSPSKLFMEVGVNVNKGLELGLLNSASRITDAMQTVLGNVVAPAAAAPAYASAMAARSINTSNQNINNYNLSINSSADSEPIVQDFEMLRSLAGS